MFAALGLLAIFLTFVGMTTVIWLYDRYERPAVLRAAKQAEAVQSNDMRLVDRARGQGTDPRLN